MQVVRPADLHSGTQVDDRIFLVLLQQCQTAENAQRTHLYDSATRQRHRLLTHAPGDLSTVIQATGTEVRFGKAELGLERVHRHGPGTEVGSDPFEFTGALLDPTRSHLCDRVQQIGVGQRSCVPRSAKDSPDLDQGVGSCLDVSLVDENLRCVHRCEGCAGHVAHRLGVRPALFVEIHRVTPPPGKERSHTEIDRQDGAGLVCVGGSVGSEPQFDVRFGLVPVGQGADDRSVCLDRQCAIAAGSGVGECRLGFEAGLREPALIHA